MVDQELFDFAAATLNLNNSGWTLDTSFEDIDGWTSLGYMKLITAIEDNLSIQLSMDAIMDSKTLGDLNQAVIEAAA